MEKLHLSGINFRKLNASETCVGINKKQFIESLEKIEADEKGWVNFKLVTRPEPIKGFSHYLTKMHKNEKENLNLSGNNSSICDL